MKTKLFFFLFSYLSIAQTTKLSLPNLENEFEVKVEKNSNDGIDVLVIDSKRSDEAYRKTESKDNSVSTFTSDVFTIINSKTTDYYFKIPNTSVAFKLPKTTLTHLDFTNAIALIDLKAFTSLLKTKTFYKNAKTTIEFKDYLKKMKQSGDTARVFIDDASIYFKKNDKDKIDLFNNDTITTIIDISDEAKFYNDFFTLFHANAIAIQKFLFTQKDYTSISNISFETEANKNKLEELYNVARNKSDYKLLRYVNIENALESNKYEASLKSNTDDTFILKFCNENHDCVVTSKINFSVLKSDFDRTINNFIKTDLKETVKKITASDLDLLYNDCKTINEKTKIDKATEPFKEDLKTMLEKIENLETQYSGILKINKEIRVYKRDKNTFALSGTMTEVKNTTFIVKDTTYIRFFNNRAKDMHIRGYLKNNPDIEFRILNFGNSVPLRSFNNSTHYIPISPKDNDANEYYININDLFDFDNDKSWNYSVRNKEYNLLLKKPVKIEERKLMDYFTAVLFSDFLGLNNANANGLIQAEGRLKIPIWIFNYGATSYMNSLNADVNATLYNGFEDKSRYITPLETKYNTINADKIDHVKINNFDYIKFSNFNAGLYLNCLNFELKGLSTEWSFGVGGRYYRSALRNTLVKDGKEDIVTNYQLNALTYELNTNFEIRPQLNFGADLNIAYNWLHPRGATDNLKMVLNEENENNDKRVIRLQLNLYSKLNPDKSNDGIYARLGGYYQLGAKDFYPQILVGYATNLSSFVNKFKK